MSDQTPPMSMDQLFNDIARNAAFAAGQGMAPPVSVQVNDPFAYLPRTPQQRDHFKPHQWAINAMWRAHEVGKAAGQSQALGDISQMQENYNAQLLRQREEIQRLQRVIQKHELVNSIRDEIMSFSVNTKDAMSLVEELARMVL